MTDKKDEFIPEDTEIPKPKSNYMTFQPEENRVRILSTSIIGYKLWTGGKPIRKVTEDEFTVEELAQADINKFTGEKRSPQYFWAFIVYNYATKGVEILEITQTTIMKPIKAILRDEDFGRDIKKYDLVVVQDAEQDPVVYSVRPKPPKPLDKGIQAYCDELVPKIDLHKLYKGEDPFADQQQKEEEEFDVPDTI